MLLNGIPNIFYTKINLFLFTLFYFYFLCCINVTEISFKEYCCNIKRLIVAFIKFGGINVVVKIDSNISKLFQ